MKDTRKYEKLGFFSSERTGMKSIINILRDIVSVQRELLDYQAAKIFKLQEELEELKK